MKLIHASLFRFVLLLVVLLLVWFGRSHQQVSNPSWEQPTMGTLCHITISGSISKSNLSTLREEVDVALLEVNHRMSTWQSDTEISQFNSFHLPSPEGYGVTRPLEPFLVSSEFLTVVRRALKIAEITDGAFDPTVKPLVDHWGFGPEVDPEPLVEIMQAVGWEKVALVGNHLSKKEKNVQLDLSAIAKGYGVDTAANVLRRNGIMGFIVEIGGEIVASGLKANGQPWRVGVESPNAAQGDGVFQTLELSDGAMATSGDYRNFRTREDGTRFSHIIDPITGHPAETDIASVSVLANSCMDADAVATALFVMGSKKSFQWLKNYSEFEAFFILHSTNGTFTTRTTDGFPLEP